MFACPFSKGHPMSAKETVVAAATRLFIEQDPSVVAEAFGPTYVQHSSLAADGVDGLNGLANNLHEGFKYKLARVIADDGLVVLHGVYTGFGPVPLVGFDVFRAENGRIVEHWDALAPQVTETVSGRTQIDGPSEARDLDKTAANKALVAEFAEKVLVGQDYSVLTDYISTESYAQHNPEAGDGLDGFGAAVGRWAEDGKNLVYKTIHQVVAEGDFVFTRAEGEFGVPVVYSDLWRVENGKIVEHWDVIAPIPAEVPHTNGLF
jgi:predicted SnoaL-like aldol condensation-catalyzing enzyme